MLYNTISLNLTSNILNYDYKDSNVILELYRIKTDTKVDVTSNKIMLTIRYARIKKVNSNVNIKDKEEIERINDLK